MKPFLIRWLVTTIAVLIAVTLVPGISAGGTLALLAASLFLGIINALLRPILLLLSFPLIILSLGLFIFVINAFLLWMVSGIVPGFEVEGFVAALLGAIIISVTSWLMSVFFRDSTGHVHVITHHPTLKQARGRVLDE